MKHSKLLILHRKVNRTAPGRGRGTGFAPALLALLAASLCAAPAAAKTYRWVDDDGVVVYSQTPPRDGRPTADVRPPPPPPVPPGEARRRLEERMQRLDDLREDKELAREKRAETQEGQTRRRRACEAARSNLSALQRSMNKRLRLPDGSYQRLDEDERQARLREARRHIEENCDE